MKKHIITGITLAARVALCTAVWPRSAEVENLPAKPMKTTVTAEIGARSEEASEILLSADVSAPKAEVVAESEPKETEITAKKKQNQCYQQRQHQKYCQHHQQLPKRLRSPLPTQSRGR